MIQTLLKNYLKADGNLIKPSPMIKYSTLEGENHDTL